MGQYVREFLLFVNDDQSGDPRKMLSKRTQDIVGEKFMKFSEGNVSYRRRMQLEH